MRSPGIPALKRGGGRVFAALAAAPALLLLCEKSAASMPAPGTNAPAIPTLQSVFGGAYQPFDLKAATSGKAIVLYFFPEAFTEG